LTLVGIVLSSGYPAWLAPWVAVSPMRFFRANYRFAAIAGFGNALLLAAGLDAIRRLARPLGVRVPLVVGAFGIGARGLTLVSFRTCVARAITRGAEYRQVGAVARAQGSGPLLEVPLTSGWKRTDVGWGLGPKTLEPDAMLGSTFHWLPLLDAYTGYHPP